MQPTGRHTTMSILWIILIVILVLVLLGFFGRGRY
jgi:flagellar basal body-associated protein FliL